MSIAQDTASTNGRTRGRHGVVDFDAQKWVGPTRRYDLVKEFTVAIVGMVIFVVALAVLFGSPNEKAVTIQQWAKATPNDFLATAATELDSSSVTAGYGAPYNHTPGAGQKLGPLPLARWSGVRDPVDTTRDFIIGPLETVPNDPPLTAALQQWNSASSDQQTKWATNYDKALTAAPDNNPAAVKPGDYGPAPMLLERLLSIAQVGALQGALTRDQGFYVLDYTKPLLFLNDGSYLSDQAKAQHLSGTQWGMMNETGSFPGQAWLWLYTLWYNVAPFNHSGNADALIWALMALLTLVFVAVPVIPGLRSLPRRIPVYRLIWRDWYAEQSGSHRSSGPVGPTTRDQTVGGQSASGAGRPPVPPTPPQSA